LGFVSNFAFFSFLDWRAYFYNIKNSHICILTSALALFGK
jgi:hypothetical protein